MERKNIVILGLAVLLGLMVGSAEASDPRRQRSRTSQVPQYVGTISAANFTKPASGTQVIDGDVLPVDVPGAAPAVVSASQKRLQAARNVAPQGTSEEAWVAGKMLAQQKAQQAPMLMLEDSPRFTATPPNTPPPSKMGTESVLSLRNARRAQILDANKARQQAALQDPTAGVAVHLLTNKDQNALGATPGGVFGAGVLGRNAIDGVGRVSVKPTTQSFKERFMAGARKAGSRIAASARSAGRFAKQRLTPAQQGRVGAIADRMSEINEATMKLRLSGRTDADALASEMAALSKEGRSLELEQNRIANAGRLKQGVRNTANSIRNAAARVRNALRREPKGGVAATTEALQEDGIATPLEPLVIQQMKAEAVTNAVAAPLDNQPVPQKMRMKENPLRSSRLSAESTESTVEAVQASGGPVSPADKAAQLNRLFPGAKPSNSPGSKKVRAARARKEPAAAKLASEAASGEEASEMAEGPLADVAVATKRQLLARPREEQKAEVGEGYEGKLKAKTVERDAAAGVRRERIIAERKAKAAKLGSEKVEAARVRREAAVEAAKLASETAPVAEQSVAPVPWRQGLARQERLEPAFKRPSGPRPAAKEPNVIRLSKPDQRRKVDSTETGQQAAPLDNQPVEAAKLASEAAPVAEPVSRDREVRVDNQSLAATKAKVAAFKAKQEAGGSKMMSVDEVRAEINRKNELKKQAQAASAEVQQLPMDIKQLAKPDPLVDSIAD